MRATHFKKIKNEKSNNPTFFYTPCDPDDPNAIKMTIWSLNHDELILPDIAEKDFETALQAIKPSVSKKDLEMQEKFTRLFGMGGDRNDTQESKPTETQQQHHESEAESKLMKFSNDTTEKVSKMVRRYSNISPT